MPSYARPAQTERCGSYSYFILRSTQIDRSRFNRRPADYLDQEIIVIIDAPRPSVVYNRVKSYSRSDMTLDNQFLHVFSKVIYP